MVVIVAVNKCSPNFLSTTDGGSIEGSISGNHQIPSEFASTYNPEPPTSIGHYLKNNSSSLIIASFS
jgi:hypothetical protein